ncbi:uncharacterized protein LOC112039328 [Quercus suber]|nr:UPF0690 protein C1orf52 homolog [Quercus suber]XP_023927966.1 UPF0690 protein C1orf52 homolog [Quercus suber]XP_023927967.1 UPF0690 protein C1orf52 homolog [Quercus suber]XP_023927968.1 UPF0690 protein C1orf52 homolog [Quercus suber]POE91339.1 upf0690 protein [Quercus suber]
MKRTIPWSDEEDDSSDDESLSSHSDSGSEDGVDQKKAKDPSKHSKEKNSKAKSRKQKTGVLDFEELKRRGYKGGPSILSVPPPKEDDKQDWSWSNGKESHETKETEETYEERQKTRAALASGEKLVSVETRKDRKNLSFSQKEKRKRELGQASRGKNYVEEEKRLLRENGIYSGFDA